MSTTQTRKKELKDAQRQLIDAAWIAVQMWDESPYVQVEKIPGGFHLVEAVRRLNMAEADCLNFGDGTPIEVKVRRK